MIIIHDFFLENGGGENLIISIAKKFNIKIITAYSKIKISLIKESKFNFILQNNKVLTFIYYYFFFKVSTNKKLIFSGNHCVYSNHKCIAKQKILYAHSLPKYLYSELYLGTSTNFFFDLFKGILKKKYKKNIFLFDEIIFNSIKTKSKFTSVFPDLLNFNMKLKVIYPFSEIIFLNKDFRNITKNYLVINSRHTPTKNINKILIKYLNAIKDRKISIYITHEGINSEELRKEFLDYSEYIFFTGYLEIDDYQKLLSESLGVLFPSLDEDFGIAALDAYNLNIPILLYKNCGFSEILDNFYDFFIDDKDPNEIIDLLLQYRDEKINIYKNKIDLKVKLFKYFNKYYE